MKHFVLAVCSMMLSISLFAQGFEGKIVYQNTYRYKQAGLTSDEFAKLMGTQMEGFFKGGQYKYVLNGTFCQWQLYVNADNKVYNKFSNSDLVLWDDATKSNDEILKVEINRGAETILGYVCDEVILTCKKSVKKYYYNTELKANAEDFKNHKRGSWYYILKKTGSLPLKTVDDSEQYTMICVATAIVPMALDQSIFVLPVGLKTAPSPF